MTTNLEWLRSLDPHELKRWFDSPHGGAVPGKVYLACWCNNDTYEDYSEDVEAVCSTYEGAVRHIESCGYELRTDPDDYYVRRGIKRWDKRIDEWDTFSMWVREMEVGE